jgi:yeast amino acid transporter
MADADLALHDDVEKVAYKNGNSSDETYPAPQYDKDAQAQISSVTTHHDGFFSTFTPNSFKGNPNARVVTEATDLEGRPLPDQPPAEPALARKLKPRHLQMIAIGGSIGVLPSKYQQV